MPSSISVALKGSQVSPKITCSYTYIYVAGCYAAWNNNYSGQEETTLCIVKCFKEDRKLVAIPYEKQNISLITMS